MLFVIIATDRPGSLDLRLATRERHLAYLDTYVDRIVQAGAMLDLDGRPCGSVLLVDVADRETADGFAAADPYNQVNLFESVIVRAFRQVYAERERVT